MLTRRQALAGFASGLAVFGTAAAAKRGLAVKATDDGDRTGWIPQLSRTAEVLAEAESADDRFAAEVVHRMDFLPGVTLLLHRTNGKAADSRLRSVRERLVRHGIAVSNSGMSHDGSTWALFACADRNTVESTLRSRIISA